MQTATLPLPCSVNDNGYTGGGGGANHLNHHQLNITPVNDAPTLSGGPYVEPVLMKIQPAQALLFQQSCRR